MTVISSRQRMIRRSIIVLVLMIVVGFGASIVSLIQIQLIKGNDYRAKAESNQLQDTVIEAQRGTIYDANMKVIAQSASVWKIYVNPSAVKSEGDVAEKLIEEITENLSEILGITQEKILNSFSNLNYSYMTVKRGVENAEKDAVSEFLNTCYTGSDKKQYYYSKYIGIDPDVKRYYPFSTFASALIGFTGTDDIGRSGLELKYNSTLTGVPGRIITAQNGALQSGSMPVEYETVYDAKQGTSLVLTIDEAIERYLEKALEQAYIDTGAAGVSGIIMDVKTGAVLAMANMPNYDLNSPHSIVDIELSQKIAEIEDSSKRNEKTLEAQYTQWRNASISDTYEPGSVFKVVTASAAIEENTYSLSRSYTCVGSIKVADRNISCHRHSGHGTQTLSEGLMNSCNPLFITVGQSLGAKTFFKYFEAFGFTETTGIDLPAEAVPVAGVTYHALNSIGIVELASSSFGQSFQVTPIQIITAISCIANGGKLMTPYVVEKQLDEQGNVVFQTEPQVRRQVISESTADTVASMMEGVVSKGTGKNAYVAGYRVAGKTGTSEKLNKDGYYIASFAGFAPADDPRIAILIAIDEPSGENTGGGAIAAPVAAEVLESALTYLNVEPQYTDAELALLDTAAPNLIGMDTDSAAAELRSEGFSVRIIGDGDVVVSQIPAYNQALPRNGIVILYSEENIERETSAVPDFTGLSITEANKRAVAGGLNIKISGNSLKSSELVAYKQSIEAGVAAELGQIITVYFKSNTDIADFG